MFLVCARSGDACAYALKAYRMRFGFFRAIFCLAPFVLLCVPMDRAQTASESTAQPRVPVSSSTGCEEAPQEDALASTCAPATLTEGDEIPVIPVVVPPSANIALAIPTGTPIRIALDQRTRVEHAGELVHGKVVETVYAFDQAVIPAGTVATGHVIQVAGVSTVKRAMAYSNGNFSPYHQYVVTFDTLTLPDGRRLAVETTVSVGTADVVHLVSNPDNDKQKGAAGQAADRARREAKGKIQEAKDQVHDSWQKMTAPGKMHRLKEYLLAQSPYRRQYLEPGTRFVADLEASLNFGEATRSGEQLAGIGSAPLADSTLKARLVAEVSSATASRGTLVAAVLTEPLFSASHQLILPANSRLIGEVVQAKPARMMHHNGELRVIFERIETPEDVQDALLQMQRKTQAQAGAENAPLRPHVRSQAMIGNLEGVEVDRRANMKLDEEGGAHTTDSKTRYLSTGLAVLLAAAAAHPDGEHGTVDAGGDPGVRTAAGGSGFRLTGALLSFVVKSPAVSMAFGAYGASASIYTNFLSRGHDVILPRDTPLEIGFGAPHAAAPAQPKAQ
jgi:hypothetical protein